MKLLCDLEPGTFFPALGRGRKGEGKKDGGKVLCPEEAKWLPFAMQKAPGHHRHAEA